MGIRRNRFGPMNSEQGTWIKPQPTLDTRGATRSFQTYKFSGELWQGGCRWTNVAGRVVTLADTSLPQLTELERLVLQKVALAKLQALNLGVNIKIPSESCGAAVVQKPKRRAYLLKRKAITTSVFDTSRKDDKDKGTLEYFAIYLY
ncbi:hypothetical protein AAG570_005445 [Ranatra chinensis]|uniref:Uncharacterized protein n=1 Tax=Ranatra chinensis TaxID=642074 RepID=A0ABD0XZ63_9HEMI